MPVSKTNYAPSSDAGSGRTDSDFWKNMINTCEKQPIYLSCPDVPWHKNKTNEICKVTGKDCEGMCREEHYDNGKCNCLRILDAKSSNSN